MIVFGLCVLLIRHLSVTPSPLGKALVVFAFIRGVEDVAPYDMFEHTL